MDGSGKRDGCSLVDTHPVWMRAECWPRRISSVVGFLRHWNEVTYEAKKKLQHFNVRESFSPRPKFCSTMIDSTKVVNRRIMASTAETEII